MKTFNETEKQFLASYRPADKHFTYISEIEQVTKALGLLDMSVEQLQETRDAVVKYYCKLQDAEFDNYWDLNNAMKSVTAVIDSTAVCGAFAKSVAEEAEKRQIVL